MGKRETETRQCSRLRWIYFVDPDDQEDKETSQKYKNKFGKDLWHMPCLAKELQTPPQRCFHSRRLHPQTVCGCIVGSHDSGITWITRQRVESSQPRNDEEHIAGKGYTSMTHYNFGAQVCSDAPSDENSGCESSSGWIMWKARDDHSMVIGESGGQEGGHPGNTKRQSESPLCHTDGYMSCQEWGVRTQITKM